MESLATPVLDNADAVAQLGPRQTRALCKLRRAGWQIRVWDYAGQARSGRALVDGLEPGGADLGHAAMEIYGDFLFYATYGKDRAILTMDWVAKADERVREMREWRERLKATPTSADTGQ